MKNHPLIVNWCSINFSTGIENLTEAVNGVGQIRTGKIETERRTKTAAPSHKWMKLLKLMLYVQVLDWHLSNKLNYPKQENGCIADWNSWICTSWSKFTTQIWKIWLYQTCENYLPIGQNEILSFIEPIREGVRKSSLMCKFLMNIFQSHIIIGWTCEHFMIWTNQKWC